MEDQNSPIHTPLIDQTIEIRSSSANDISQGGSKICGGVTCGFSVAGAASKDANERSASMKKLGIAVILCVVFMSIEVVGGIKANSLAILTDAAHLLSDVAAFAISMFSLWAAGREATPRQSYGFYRIEILGALVSIQLIWLSTGMLVYEAIVRLLNDSGEVQGFLMFLVSAFGLLVNMIMAIVLDHDHGHGHGHGHIYGHGEHHSHDHSHANHGHGHVHGVEHKHGHEITVTTHHHHSGHTKLEHEHEPLILKNSGDVEDYHAHGMEHRHGHDVTVTTTHHHHSGHTELEHEHEPLILKDSEDMEDPQANSKDNKRKQRNINVQGAYLHVLGDCIQSVGVMIGGGIIWYKPEWKIIDLICTLVFSVIVLVTTIRMLRNILEILMESTPREIDATRLEKGLCELDGVVAVHELHIWAITVGKVLLACHVTITPEADPDLVLDKVIGYINREYNISHVTIQIERQ